MPFPIAAAIMAGAAVTGSAINAASQARQNKKNYKYNKALSEQAFRQNKQMWSMENQYNSPSAQMARYQAAGINPNVLYGQGSDVSSGNSQDAPALEYPAYQGKAPFFDIESPIQALVTPYQISNIESQTAENYSNVDFLGAKTKRILTLLPQEQANLDAKTMQLKTDIAFTNVKIRGLNLDNKLKERTLEVNAKCAELQYDFMSAQVEVLKVEKDLKRKQIDQVDKAMQESDARIRKLGEEADKIFRERTSLYDSIENLNYARAFEADANTQKLSTQNDILEKELAHWEERFHAEVAQMAMDAGLKGAQISLYEKRVKNFVWTEIISPLIKAGIIAGAAVAAKGKAGPKGPAPSPVGAGSPPPTPYN